MHVTYEINLNHIIQNGLWCCIVFFFFLDVDINNPGTFAMLDSPQMVSAIAKNLKYFTKQGGMLTVFVFKMKIDAF